MRVELVQAYILHVRNYTDSRVLVELFSVGFGRLSSVARTGKQQSRFSVLRPFQPLLVSWQGKGDLKTLTHVEQAGPLRLQAGTSLFCGMYLNELLLRVLPAGDPHDNLFADYDQALKRLECTTTVEPVLRQFELDLLAELGYAIPFDADIEVGAPISSQCRYLFDPAGGFSPVAEVETGRNGAVFEGADIIAIREKDFSQQRVASAAKHLCRLALHPLLGGKPLKSRELFR